MASRHQDWLNQGQRDVELARWCIQGGHFDWACFACQQAAEKAIKAVFQNLGGEAWGHAATRTCRYWPVSRAARPGSMSPRSRIGDAVRGRGHCHDRGRAVDVTA